jgi:plastocyanin
MHKSSIFGSVGFWLRAFSSTAALFTKRVTHKITPRLPRPWPLGRIFIEEGFAMRRPSTATQLQRIALSGVGLSAHIVFLCLALWSTGCGEEVISADLNTTFNELGSGDTGHEHDDAVSTRQVPTYEVRFRYESVTVPFGQSCVGETQSRTYNSGTFGGWSGTHTHQNCEEESPANCGETVHGQKASRTRYAADSAPVDGTCNPETQLSTCENGSFDDWSGTYLKDNCRAESASACDDAPHGGAEDRMRYAATTVAFGQLCVSEPQNRTCNNGNFSRWSGSYTYTACRQEDPAMCESTPHNGRQTRRAFAELVAPFGETCIQISEAQTRTCENGRLGDWSGTYLNENCSEADVIPVTPGDCGQTRHGANEDRTRYMSATVPAGELCENVAEIQTRTCEDGTFGVWSGSYDNVACVVSCGENCGITSRTFEMDIGADGNDENFRFRGDFMGDDPELSVNVGDTLIFNVSTRGDHVFWLKTQQIDDIDHAIDDGTVENNGSDDTPSIVWKPTEAGTYYYNCEFHEEMTNAITVNPAP